MNLPSLFNSLRSLAGSLSQEQVDSVNAILSACTIHGVTDDRQIAYTLATCYHESRLKPISEIGKGVGHSYGIADTVTGQTYYGRGFVQLTWKSNYAEFGRLLNIDLVNHPELVLNIPTAAEIIVIGMKGGLFTGVGLGKYFNDAVTDAVNARRIINGTDCAQLIAGYYAHIFEGISS